MRFSCKNLFHTSHLSLILYLAYFFYSPLFETTQNLFLLVFRLGYINSCDLNISIHSASLITYLIWIKLYKILSKSNHIVQQR